MTDFQFKRFLWFLAIVFGTPSIIMGMIEFYLLTGINPLGLLLAIGAGLVFILGSLEIAGTLARGTPEEPAENDRS